MMERDFVGYGEIRPKVVWPDQGKVAVNFVLNYEEGGEQNILDGDKESESYLTDLPTVKPLAGQRHLSVESLFEYGSRLGVWRILKLFDEFNIPLTVFATGLALQRNRPLCEKLKNSSHEVAGHGYRWINYADVSEKIERQHIADTIAIIEGLGKKAEGWYTGRKSLQTRKLIVEAGLQYDSDSYADDLPYWVQVEAKNHLIIPYNLDDNDMRYGTTPGWSTGADFFNYLKAAFDCLYREEGNLMTIGLHPRFSGHPGRAEALRQFIEYVLQHKKVWVCRRADIAHFWRERWAI